MATCGEHQDGKSLSDFPGREQVARNQAMLFSPGHDRAGIAYWIPKAASCRPEEIRIMSSAFSDRPGDFCKTRKRQMNGDEE